MRRTLVSTLSSILTLVLLPALGLVPTVTRAAPPEPARDTVETIAALPATDAERSTVERWLVRVLKSLPAPEKGFRLEPDGASEEIGRVVLKLEGKKPWGPLDASAERIFGRIDASDDEDRTLEVRVSVNGTRGLSTGLASAGGAPRAFPLEGAFALVQTLIGADDAAQGSRVALPMDEDQAARSVALLRIYIAPKELEVRLRSSAQGSEELPAFDPGFTPSSKRVSPRAMVVEIHGQRRDVESYAKRVPVGALRRQLEG